MGQDKVVTHDSRTGSSARVEKCAIWDETGHRNVYSRITVPGF